MLLANGRVLVVVGQTGEPEFADATNAALLSQAAWATLRAHALHVRDAGALLSLTAKSLWPMPGAIQHVSAAVAPSTLSAAGSTSPFRGTARCGACRAAATEQLTVHQPPLGTSCDFAYRSHVLELSLRERLILVADEPAYRMNRCVAALESAFTHLSAESHRRMTAVDAVAIAREQFDGGGEGDAQTSASIVAVRRR